MSTRRPNVPRAAKSARSTSGGQAGGSGVADGAGDRSRGPAESRVKNRVETGDDVISAEVLHPDFGSGGKDGGRETSKATEKDGGKATGNNNRKDAAGGTGSAAKAPSGKAPSGKKSRSSAAARRASERDSAKFAVRQPVVSWNRNEPGAEGSGTGNGTAGDAGSAAGGEPVPAKSFSGRLLALAVVLIAMVVILAPTVQTYVEQRMEINALQSDISAQQAEQDRLQTQLSRWEDPAYIKQQARKRLFLVMPGETRYLVVGADEATQPEQAPSPPTGDEDDPWVDALFESIKRSATD